MLEGHKEALWLGRVSEVGGRGRRWGWKVTGTCPWGRLDPWRRCSHEKPGRSRPGWAGFPSPPPAPASTQQPRGRPLPGVSSHGPGGQEARAGLGARDCRAGDSRWGRSQPGLVALHGLSLLQALPTRPSPAAEPPLRLALVRTPVDVPGPETPAAALLPRA